MTETIYRFIIHAGDSMKMKRIAIVPGDGIGIDVTKEAVKVLDTLREQATPIELTYFDYSADRYLKTGIAMPPGGMDELAGFDAIFMGAFGDPRVPDMAHAREILLGCRFQLDLYVNHRPIKLLSDDLSPLKSYTSRDINFVIFRENTEEAYVGIGGNFKKGTLDEVALQEMVFTRKGVERIVRYAFEYAKREGKKSVVMADKSNALRFGGDLWQRVFSEVQAGYPEIEARHLYIDALAMQMVKNPSQFEIIVTSNMFGDIVTDLGAALQGGLGMAASGNINPELKRGMFEPVHGSAPKYAGRNSANPIAAILTVAMMLEFLGFANEAKAVESSVIYALKENIRTRDIKGSSTTEEMGNFIASKVKKLIMKG